MVFYQTASQYMESCTSTRARIAKIDTIIDALLDVAIKAAENGDISQYSVDNGQSVIMTSYRTAKDVADSILAFQNLRALLVNKKVGRGLVRLMDSKNFRQ